MAFQNVVFPELRLIHGMSRTRQDNTVVFGNGYNEYRIRRGSSDPLRWDFPSRDMFVDDARALIKFYNDMSGSMDSFKFRDPDDYKWTDFSLKYHSGIQWELKSASGSPIFLLDGALTLKIGTTGAGTTTTVDIINGVPTVSVSGSISSDNVNVTGQFYHSARFASTLSYTITALDVSNDTVAAGMGNVTLQEVKEYA